MSVSGFDVSSLGLLGAIGPQPNFMGNDYTKYLASSGLSVANNPLASMAPDLAKKLTGGFGADIAQAAIVPAVEGVARSFWPETLTGAIAGASALAQNAERLGAASGAALGAFTIGYEKQLGAVHEAFQSVFDRVVKQPDFRTLRKTFLPPNLVDLGPEFSLHDVWDFVQEYGVPLLFVPRARIAARLLRAQDKGGVRDVLGKEFDNLVDDCETAVDQVKSVELSEYVEFVNDAIGSIRAGHTRSAQAMLTVLLDTFAYQQNPLAYKASNKKEAKRLFSMGISAYKPDRKEEDQVELEDELTIRAAMVWYPIRNVHYLFDRDVDETVPHDYGRHPSTHAVCKRQYTKRNCVQVLMVVCSLLAHVNVEKRRQEKHKAQMQAAVSAS